jgi:hypothetical protein
MHMMDESLSKAIGTSAIAKKRRKPVTIADKIKMVFGVGADLHDGCAVYGGHIFKVVNDVVTAYFKPETTVAFEDLVEDTEFNATVLGKLQDFVDGTTEYLTVDEQADLAKAEILEAFQYKELFEYLWQRGVVQHFLILLMKERYTGNPAYLAGWHDLVAQTDIPTSFGGVS